MIIYKITHIPSGKFYIGRTTQKLEIRIKQHKQQTKTKNIISSLLRKYPDEEFEYIIVDGIVGEKNDATVNHLIELEQKYIDVYYKEELCINLSKCAKGPTYSQYKNRKQYKQTSESIKKFRDNYLIWWNNRTPKEDLERRIKLRQAHEKRLIPIEIFNLNDEYIDTFPSIRSIVRTYSELDRAAILRVLQKKSKFHKGYIFKYKNQQ